ncbi:MAG: hypothetical protein L7U72_02290, partial [Rubripirellula sp.]|nr:hypothetical protein [Rubripirellula sp.]
KLGIHRYSSEARDSNKRHMPLDWLRQSGTLDLKEMRMFAPYLTNLGNAYHFISSGVSHPNEHRAHQEVVLDFRYTPSRVVFSRSVDPRSLLMAQESTR